MPDDVTTTSDDILLAKNEASTVAHDQTEIYDVVPEEFLPKKASQVGDIIKGTVLSITDEYAVVDIGQKAEGIVPLRELRQSTSETPLAKGDIVNAYVIRSEASRGGITELSVDRAQTAGGWQKLEDWMNENATVKGKIVDLNRGGVIILTEGVQGFIPLSHLSSPYREIYTADEEMDLTKLKKELMDKDIEFKIIDFNKRRARAIFSHRLAVQEVRKQQKLKIMETLQEGQVIKGTIVGLSDFGAFVDIGGADGLIHISELSWEQVRKPSEILSVGQQMDVHVLKVDVEQNKIALSLKRLTPEPWKQAGDKFVEGSLVKVTITNIVQFGAFAKVMPGIEGLIHLSELSHSKIAHPSDVVKEGDELDVMILKVDVERKRLALSLKRTLAEPVTSDDYTDSSEQTESDSTDAVTDNGAQQDDAQTEVISETDTEVPADTEADLETETSVDEQTETPPTDETTAETTDE